MGVLHITALVVGLALAALPVIVHLLTRPRPVRYPFAPMRFLEGALKQRRFFSRVRDVAVLTARVLLLAAIALAFARPLLRGPEGPAAGAVGRRVVVLDVSASMAAGRGGAGAFPRAQALALQYLKKDGARANVILAGAQPRPVFDRLSANLPALEAAVLGAAPCPEVLDPTAALDCAARMFLNPPPPAGAREQLVLITDLQETNWRSVARGGLPPGIEIVVEFAGLAPRTPNLAVTDAGIVGRVAAGRAVMLRAEVSNFTEAEQTRTVEMTVEDRAYRQTVTCRPWGQAVALIETPWQPSDADAGWITGRARLLEANDALATDDTRHFAVEVARPTSYALVTARTDLEVGTPTYLVARMFCPDAGRAGGERLTRLAARSLHAEALARTDIIIVHRPGRLQPEGVQALAAALRRGCSVIYIAGEPADAENLAAVGQAMKGALRLPVVFTGWESGSRIHARANPELRVREVRATLPPFSAFGADAQSLASALTAARALKTSADPQGAPDDVLAAWDDGAAALVLSRAGAGTLVVWNADLEGTTLPRDPFFVALMRETARMLIETPSAGGAALPCGAARTIPLPSTDGRLKALEAIGPDGLRMEGFAVKDGPGGPAWHWERVGPPGVYRVKSGPATVLAVATACPPEESDLRPIAVGALQARLAPASNAAQGTAVTVLGAPGIEAPRQSAEIWPWLLVAAIVLLVVELILLKLFRV